jgi:hypothetical protein
VDSLQQWEKRDSLSSPSHYGRFVASGELVFFFLDPYSDLAIRICIQEGKMIPRERKNVYALKSCRFLGPYICFKGLRRNK